MEDDFNPPRSPLVRLYVAQMSLKRVLRTASAFSITGQYSSNIGLRLSPVPK